MAKLNNARTNAAKAVADKLAKVDGSITSTSPVDFAIGEPGAAVTVPGLLAFAPNSVAAMLPPFNPEQYSIADPLNPPESLPQVSLEQHAKGMERYQGAMRALELTGASLDLTKQKFVVVGKHAQAIAAGNKAAVDVEKAKGAYIDWLKEVEVTQQKGIALNLSQYKTESDRSAAIHTKAELDELLKQSRIRAELASKKTLEAQGKLEEFQRTIQQYLPASRGIA